jgi:hypothetical protein
MSDLSRRSGNRTTRSQREARAFRLAVATGTFAVAAVVTFVLAVIGAGGFGWFVLAVLAAALSGFLFRRSVGG